jgi:hypothetical protein
LLADKLCPQGQSNRQGDQRAPAVESWEHFRILVGDRVECCRIEDRTQAKPP